VSGPPEIRYRAEIFDTSDITAAKEIILQPEPGMDTEARWRIETGFLADWMAGAIKLAPNALALDFGCGVGRLSKLFVDRFGVATLGVDISAPMRAMALEYVGSPHFTAVSSEMFTSLVRGGLRADIAVAAWVLQHVLDLPGEIDRLWHALKPGGLFVVLNMHRRCIPTTAGWADDHQDVNARLLDRFEGIADVPIPLSASASEVHAQKFLRVYRKAIDAQG
jgi:ubiquinone/menaquinone biosynthesis C-methylase UbiE